ELRAPGTLAHWLTERYCLYTVARNNVYRAEIHHTPWPLQDAEAEIHENTMAATAGIDLPQVAPLLHFSRRIDVIVWPLKRLDNQLWKTLLHRNSAHEFYCAQPRLSICSKKPWEAPSSQARSNFSWRCSRSSFRRKPPDKC